MMQASATRSSQNSRASSRAASTANCRSNASNETSVRTALIRARAEDPLDHAALQSCRSTLFANQQAGADRRQRFAERRIGRIGQPRLAVERAEA